MFTTFCPMRTRFCPMGLGFMRPADPRLLTLVRAVLTLGTLDTLAHRVRLRRPGQSALPRGQGLPRLTTPPPSGRHGQPGGAVAAPPRERVPTRLAFPKFPEQPGRSTAILADRVLPTARRLDNPPAPLVCRCNAFFHAQQVGGACCPVQGQQGGPCAPWGSGGCKPPAKEPP